MHPIIFIGIKFIGVFVTTQENVLLLKNLTEQKARQILNEVIQNSINVKFSKHALVRMEESG